MAFKLKQQKNQPNLDGRLISFAVIPNGLLTQSRDCRFHFAQTSSQMGSLPKAFQKQTKFAFGFSHSHQLTQASL
jgi:hypothetical protein